MTDASALPPPAAPPDPPRKAQNGASKARNGGGWRKVLRRLLAAKEGEAGGSLEDVLRERAMSGEVLETSQTDMLLKAARFDQLTVADVMTPRPDIIWIDAGATLAEAAHLFADSQHSRLPLFGASKDDPMGFVHVKDLMRLIAPDETGAPAHKHTDRVLARIKRDVPFVPPSMRLPKLLLKMRAERSHLVLVVDEYGGTDGLVTIEDVVEAIFGDIDDEHDEVAALLVQANAGVFEVDGRADIETLEEALGQSLALPEQEDEFDTAAGLANAIAGRLPQRGEVLHHPAGLEIEVIDADPRRVKRLRIKPKPAATGEPAGGEGTG